MISSPALPTADPTAPPLLSAAPNNAGGTTPGGSGSGAGSFQNIFALVVAPAPQAVSMSTAQPAAAPLSKTNFVLTLQATTGVAQQALPDPSTAATTTAEAAPQPPADPAGFADPQAATQVAAGLAAPTPGEAVAQTPNAAPQLKPLPIDDDNKGTQSPSSAGNTGDASAAPLPAPASGRRDAPAKLPPPPPGRAVAQKAAPRGSARQAQALLTTASSATTNDALAPNPAPPPDANIQNAAAPDQSVATSPPTQNNQAFAAPLAAPGAENPPAGAAFMLHIKAGNGQSPVAHFTSPNAAPNANNSPSDASVVASQTAAATPKTDAPPANSMSLPTVGLVSSAPQTLAPPLALSNSASSAPAASAPTAASAVADDSSLSPAQPVRSVQVQLAGADDQRVDLRLVEHAGGLSVSVRASDGVLTSSLQEHLPDLSARLAAEHYSTQVLLPFTSQTSAHGGSSGSPDSSGQQSGQSFGQASDQGGGRSFSQGGSSSGGDGNQRQGRQPDEQQEWRSAFASGAASTPALSFAGELSLSNPASNSSTNQ